MTRHTPNLSTLHRLWKLVVLLREKPGPTREDLIQQLGVESRTLAEDLSRLRKGGLRVRFFRSSGRYNLDWPEEIPPLRLSPEQFFRVYCSVFMMDLDGSEGSTPSGLGHRLKLAVSSQTDPVFDCGPAYGIGQGITAPLAPLLDALKTAVVTTKKVAFIYHKTAGSSSLRIVHPYRLVHTPVSWYVVAWCEEKQDFRNFKLARISDGKILSERYHRRPFDLQAHRGDAWWIRKGNPDDPVHLVRVLFTGEAARAVLEYHLHKSQTHEVTEDGTVVTWRLSWLGECATWLMQWLGSFVVLGPEALKADIAARVARHTSLTREGEVSSTTDDGRLAEVAEESGTYGFEMREKT